MAGTDPYAFVTVGTTRFDALATSVLTPAFAAALLSKGVARLVVQVGSSTLPAGVPEPGSTEVEFDLSSDAGPKGTAPTVRCKLYRLRPDIMPDVCGAAFVVSHAGAGSIFEALRAHRPLVVVVNEALADNHQTELADAMEGRMHCYSCGPAGLPAKLRDADFSKLQPLPSAAPGLAAFAAALDEATGFA